MKKFINEYEYNIDVIKENINSWWNIKFKKNIIILLLLFIVVAILYFISKNIIFLISIFLIIIPIIFFIIKRNNAIKIELNVIKQKYNRDSFKIGIEIDKDIVLKTPRGEKSFELDIIESFYETKNLIVLNVKNNTTIALKKDSFIRGTSKDFLSFLEKLKK